MVPDEDAEQEASEAGSSDDEAFQSPDDGHDAEDVQPLPQPGVKRKRSSLVQRQAQKVCMWYSNKLIHWYGRLHV